MNIGPTEYEIRVAMAEPLIPILGISTAFKIILSTAERELYKKIVFK